MNTPAMPVTSNAPLQEAIAPAKQNNNTASDSTFNQALSREISSRNEASRAEQSKSSDATRANQPQQKSSSNEVSKADATDKPAKSEKEDKTTDTADKTDDDAKKTAADTTAANTPAGMLALMIDAGHAIAGKAAKTDAATGTATDAPVRGKVAIGTNVTDAAAVTDDKATRVEARDKTTTDTDHDFKADLRDAKGDPVAHGKVAETSAKEESHAEALLKHVTADAATASVATPAAIPQATTVQVAALQATQATNGAGNQLAPQVGTPGWDGALAQKVVWMVAGEHQSATLTLNPPDLGPLQVVLNVSNSMASATFTAAQPEVRQALENAMPKLREMLNDAGIQLGQANVNSGTPNGNHTPRDSSSSHQSRSFDNGAVSETSTHVTRVQPATIGRGLVDTFV